MPSDQPTDLELHPRDGMEACLTLHRLRLPRGVLFDIEQNDCVVRFILSDADMQTIRNWFDGENGGR